MIDLMYAHDAGGMDGMLECLDRLRERVAVSVTNLSSLELLKLPCRSGMVWILSGGLCLMLQRKRQLQVAQG
jgi:hypothetical protein